MIWKCNFSNQSFFGNSEIKAIKAFSNYLEHWNTCETAKYLSNLLSPLPRNKFTIILNTAGFVGQSRNEKVPQNHKTVSFDVNSLFTNVPLEKTINIIIRKVYNENMIDTEIGRAQLQELLLPCMRHVDFTFGKKRNIWAKRWYSDGFPLGPLLANIFRATERGGRRGTLP